MKEDAEKEAESRMQENSGRLCSVYCPGCGKVTQKVSFNLLREAGTVKVICPVCLNHTLIEYDGTVATLTWLPQLPLH
jgi:ribosomal protein S27E